jgi:hypothetical protein
MNRERWLKIADFIDILRCIVGVLFFTAWGIWTERNNKIPFSDLIGFLKSLFCI